MPCANHSHSLQFSSEAVSGLRCHPEPQAKDLLFSASVIAFDPKKQKQILRRVGPQNDTDSGLPGFKRSSIFNPRSSTFVASLTQSVHLPCDAPAEYFMKLHRLLRRLQHESFFLADGEAFEIVEKHIAVFLICLAMNLKVRHLLPTKSQIVHPTLGHAAGKATADIVMQSVVVSPFGYG